ncbi:MAG: hypothetical protein ACKN9U_15185, partial [Pirellulaceae bacterium]
PSLEPAVQMDKENLATRSIDIPKLPEDRPTPIDREGQQKRFDLDRPMRQPSAQRSWESDGVRAKEMEEALERQWIPEAMGGERGRQVDRRASSELGLKQLADSEQQASPAMSSRLDKILKAVRWRKSEAVRAKRRRGGPMRVVELAIRWIAGWR